jgi:hypothetical protein
MPPSSPTSSPRSPRDEREQWIYAQVISGNVPNWLRTLKPISVTAPGHTATYYVTPDYFAIGSDTDYFLMPMTPLLAQRLGDRLGYSLPTRKMVNQIWTNATVKLSPSTIPADPDMITVPYFAQHNAAVRTQRNATTNAQPLGALVGGDKKDLIISARIYTNFASPSITKPVVIYGWHYTSGSPIQPVYNGHEETYADYSHGIRFVQMNLTVDGSPNTVTNVLTSADALRAAQRRQHQRRLDQRHDSPAPLHRRATRTHRDDTLAQPVYSARNKPYAQRARHRRCAACLSMAAQWREPRERHQCCALALQSHCRHCRRLFRLRHKRRRDSHQPRRRGACEDLRFSAAVQR